MYNSKCFFAERLKKYFDNAKANDVAILPATNGFKKPVLGPLQHSSLTSIGLLRQSFSQLGEILTIDIVNYDHLTVN